MKHFLPSFLFVIGDLIFTEASKAIMQYVAEVSGKGKEIDRVKEQLLLSNPVLEGSPFSFSTFLCSLLPLLLN